MESKYLRDHIQEDSEQALEKNKHMNKLVHEKSIAQKRVKDMERQCKEIKK